MRSALALRALLLAALLAVVYAAAGYPEQGDASGQASTSGGEARRQAGAAAASYRARTFNLRVPPRLSVAKEDRRRASGAEGTTQDAAPAPPAQTSVAIGDFAGYNWCVPRVPRASHRPCILRPTNGADVSPRLPPPPGSETQNSSVFCVSFHDPWRACSLSRRHGVSRHAFGLRLTAGRLGPAQMPPTHRQRGRSHRARKPKHAPSAFVFPLARMLAVTPSPARLRLTGPAHG